ncbi:6-phospho-3-hexuloisomerase [Rossellomorea sp. DA94]|uniref:6-phospho-3-hexuloisomerase n=1 Tax=Rossellomorea sp. DA94 TaxID=3038653 RepID=UPI00244B44C5|nr:6-phospho-3-hexuloisomerase [Rossellomorea sp. DA94]WGG47907.1 SIS domain-containing protein [Rossellomorea sp. DA94]
MKQLIETILHENSLVLHAIDMEETEDLVKKINDARRIFLYGEGRSGLMGKAFAMRLMHCGYNVYVIGETVTPSIEKGDLLIGISASGTSTSLASHFTKTKEKAANTFLITASVRHGLSTDGTLVIPAATKYRREEEPATIQPLGSQFDQSAHLLMDAIILALLEGENRHRDLLKRHANME